MMDIKYFHIYILCLILYLTGFSNSLNGQQKFEREFRVSEEEVPPKALEAFQNSLFTNKIKWYKEISNEGISFEAKTKKQKTRFSIEFDSLGILQDIEVKTPFADIPDEGRKAIKIHLSDEFEKWKIVKTQFQLTGIGNEMVAQFFDWKPNES